MTVAENEIGSEGEWRRVDKGGAVVKRRRHALSGLSVETVHKHLVAWNRVKNS